MFIKNNHLRQTLFVSLRRRIRQRSLIFLDKFIAIRYQLVPLIFPVLMPQLTANLHTRFHYQTVHLNKRIHYPHKFRNTMKYIFIPISIVGCGKSTVFRTLTELSPLFVHIENDYFSNKRAFYEKLQKLLEGEVPYILVDRNNHIKMHRQQLIENFKSSGVCFVALLFVPPNINKKRLYETNWKKIESRGDNHPQVKSGSDVGQAKMILGLFIKKFDPFVPNGRFDSQFDHVLQMKYGKESSRENVDKILDFVKQSQTHSHEGKANLNCDLSKISKEMIDTAFKKSMEFKISHSKIEMPKEVER